MPDTMFVGVNSRKLHVMCKMVSCIPYRGTLEGEKVCGRGWTKKEASKELEMKIKELQPYGRYLSDCYARSNTESDYSVDIPQWIASVATIFRRAKGAAFFGGKKNFVK